VIDDDEDSTRAVPRDELVRPQDAHVVVGPHEVGGDDATLAVVPGENAANNLQAAAFARTMAQEEPSARTRESGAFGSSHGAFPPSSPGGPYPAAGAPHPGWNEPQQQWNPHAGAPMQMMGQGHDRQPSSSHLPQGASPGALPGSNPHMQHAMPQSGPMSGGPHMSHGMGHAPMGMPMQPHMQGQYPGAPGGPMMMQGPMMQGQGGWPQQQQAAVGSRIRLTKQVVILAIVGVICLAIFITGVILFATTKF
jgi:hypothetical protein